MPVTPSARKALRNAQAKEVRNDEVKAQLKRLLKNATAENVDAAVSFVDKAAKRNVIHVNRAARIKSRLAKMVAGILPAKNATKKSGAKKKVTGKKANSKA